MAAGPFVASAAGPGVRLGAVFDGILRGIIEDVPEIVPGVLEGGGVAGVPDGGTAAGAVWRVCPKVFSNALLRRL